MLANGYKKSSAVPMSVQYSDFVVNFLQNGKYLPGYPQVRL